MRFFRKLFFLLVFIVNYEFIVFCLRTENILDAEERYHLIDENNETTREYFENLENSHFAGLVLSNKTRWSSDLKMGRSQLKHKGNSISFQHVFFSFMS